MLFYILLIHCFLIKSSLTLPDRATVIQHVKSAENKNNDKLQNTSTKTIVDILEPAPVQEAVEESDSFRTSHAINFNGVPFPRDSMNFKYSKPQIDSALGEMIGENIRNIIDSHHIAEDQETGDSSKTATTPANVVNIHDINLLEAGSETKHKSRIVTKKAENGKEYEYEYYYYYEDEGEGMDDEVVDSKETDAEQSIESNKKKLDIKGDIKKDHNNKNEATNDLKTNEELPVYTRFPPRENSKASTNQQIISTDAPDNRKHQVKRPSLELVDSHSFNTNDKKSSSRSFESESSKLEQTEAVNKDTDEKSAVSTKAPVTTLTDTTSFIMHKSAMDLYAILANENLNSENEVLERESTTIIEQEEASSTVRTTTARTTTQRATTTTTTTTTTQVPETKVPFGRSSLAARNRNRNTASSPHQHAATAKNQSTTTTTTTTRAPSSEGGSFKPRGRFNKPSAPRAKPSKEPEIVEKKETESEAPSKTFGRTRNRFNLKPSITRTTDASAPKEVTHSEDQTATSRSLVSRPRPTFASRSRGVPKISSSVSATTDSSASQLPTQETVAPTEQDEAKPVSSPTASRLNTRLGIGRRNPLLARKQQEAKEAQEKHDEAQKEANDKEGVPNTETGVNKLKNRPRITIAPSADKTTARPSAVSRRVNPLLKNRFNSTTSEPSTVADEKPVVEESDESDKEESVTETELKDEVATELPTPKPHGLAALRRKIILRQPGKL